MKIITTNEEYFKVIHTLTRPGSVIKIATYNLFAGVLPDGRYMNDWGKAEWHNSVGDLFDFMQKVGATVEVKVGKPLFKKCPMQENPQCAMHKQEEKWDGRLVQMDKRWPNFTFHVLGLSHMKMILIKHKDGKTFTISGGRNLTDAPLADISFVDSDPKLYAKLLTIYEELK